MQFRELSDDEWALIQPVLPPKAPTGRPRADDRQTINGILYVLLTGCRWMDLPEKYGSHKTCWRRLKQWTEQGVWERISERLLTKSYGEGTLTIQGVAVDSSTIEAKKGGNK
ncbi:MAG: IS5 family transposase [Candidatus Heimdallarchaeota archaeon]|nr:IS5 family transposase [Candidatus Heimdallarchaeota archaeon]